PSFPVVICDLENRSGDKSLNKGRANLMFGTKHRGLHHVWDAPTFKDGVAQLNDLQTPGEQKHGLLVVDTLQKALGLPGEGEDTGVRAVAGERFMRQCEALVAEGYCVLVTSQVGRGYQVTRPSLTSAKWSGAIEQTAWTILAYWISPEKNG